MSKFILYGIKNCDTVKKAMKWMDTEGIPYHFYDVRKDGLNQKTVSEWVNALPLDKLINKRGTTWRQMDPATKDMLDQNTAIDLILENPTLFKRPVIKGPHGLSVGFGKDIQENLAKKA